MAAGPTYSPIATTTATGSSTNVTFNSISGSYTDLVLVIANVTAQIDNVGITLNSDTGSNYSRVILQGNGSTASSNKNSNQTYLYTMYKDTAGGDPVMSTTQFLNYSNSTTYKSVFTRQETNSSGTKAVQAIASVWRSTSAITSISINSGSANFNSGATFTLYGIAAA
jgi:hypothetical protein